jgi:hypothetical protein
MQRFVFPFAVLLSVSAYSRAASPNPDDLAVPAEVLVKSRSLVERLGSEDYPTREAAQEQLATLGRLAKPALLAGANTSPDPEIRLRCAQLLPTANALDLKARLETFLADSGGKYEHDLPAWKEFRAVACGEWSLLGRVVWADRSLEKAARELFAGLVATPANRRLLMAIEGSRLELGELVMARRLELYNQRYPRNRGLDSGVVESRDPTLDEMAALLFADARVGSQYLPRRAASISSLMSASGFTSAARATDEKGKVYRAIAVAWLESRNEPRDMYQAMNLAYNLDLSDQACALAARLLTMPGVTPSYRGRAAANLASSGDKRHIRLLKKAANDPLVVYTLRMTVTVDGNPEEATYEIQLRDIVLAVSLQLAGQKPEDYGFADRYPADTPYDRHSFSYTRHYFPDDAARTRAFAKWSAWQKANLGE